MPYLYLQQEQENRALLVPLERFLALSGVNLTRKPLTRPDAVGILLHCGTPSIFYRPAATRFAHCLAGVLRRVEPSTVLRQEGRLLPMTIPTVLVRLPETMSVQTVGKLLCRTVSSYFRLPELPDRPERPARIRGSSPMYSVPDESSRYLRVLSPGEPITYIGSSGAWSVIRHNAEVGFCRTEQLSLV